MFIVLGLHGGLQQVSENLERQHSRAQAIQEVVEYIDGNFLLQVIEDPLKRGAVLMTLLLPTIT